ncbi:FAD-binding oxidoreductase [Limibacillus halophilus]
MTAITGQAAASSSFPDAVESLRAQIKGEALLPGDPGYDEARAVWNAMIDRRPAAILRCDGVADVIAAVKFAKSEGLPVSIRGGGHNVAGHAVCDDGLMIDLSMMRAVHVDPVSRRARIEGGGTWGDLDRETQAFGLATPGGLISDTGVGGLTLNGGIGWLRSRYGLCIDNLTSVDLVTAEGELITANSEQNPDVFWALRGGGGNFGVVTSFEFKLYPVGPIVAFAAPIYPLSAGSGPIKFWRDYLADKNGDIGSLVEFSTVPESEDFPKEYWGQKVYTVAAVYAGDAEEGMKLLQPLREQGELVTDFSGEIPYCDLQKLFDELMPAGQYRCYWKCHYLSGLSDELIEEILEGVATTPSPNTLSSIWNFGGATAAVPAADTALGDRSMPYMFSIDSVWPDAADDEKNMSWTRAFWERMKQHSQKGRIYLNFPGHGEDQRTLVRQAFGDNYKKLAAIKAKYDPQNMFRFNQNIPPEG